MNPPAGRALNGMIYPVTGEIDSFRGLPETGNIQSLAKIAH